jgi:hypothetical protein
MTYLKPAYQSSNFSLITLLQHESVRFCLQIHNHTVNTRSLPHTFSLLQQNCPQVLDSECFNNQNLAFDEEVKATEIGHLFEHILLEYLCQEKEAAGFSNLSFSGRTNWNWDRSPYGCFHISIQLPWLDHPFLESALFKTILLTEKILTLTPSKKQAATVLATC